MATSTDNQVRRNPKAVVERLREEAKSNPVFSAMCHLFASRERTRQQLTIANLRISMSREGFHYSRADYEKALKFMANLGIGRLDYETGGILRSLKDIRITLQSVGYAALGKEDTLSRFEPAQQFQALPVTPKAPALKPVAPSKPTPVVPNKAPSYPATLVVMIEGQSVSFPLQDGLTPSELGLVLNSLFNPKPQTMDV